MENLKVNKKKLDVLLSSKEEIEKENKFILD